jgi:hypothetical protein
MTTDWPFVRISTLPEYGRTTTVCAPPSSSLTYSSRRNRLPLPAGYGASSSFSTCARVAINALQPLR